ncbi:MAG: hypothetical protein GXO57_04390, partial [Thermodesulfobacteria bacterium]|nr:hypothetical protein [Thermodesulfobacteriota bacterium]
LVLGEQVEEVINKIEEAIKSGKKLGRAKNTDVYLPNNVFIDGRRGSGKTTILLTVKALLEQKEKCLSSNNGISEIAKVVESLIDTSVNTSSITFYFLSWLKKEIDDKYYSNAKLTDQLYKTIKLFPGYLKTCDELCQDLDKNEEIEEALDKSDLNFRRELFKLIDLFLEEEKKDAIILFVDDIDISFPPKRIEKILTEIFMFLSHPKLLIVSAGNYQNLIESLECFVEETTRNCQNTYKHKEIANNEKLKNISKSLLEKTFSRYRVRIPELSYESIKNLRIKFQADKNIGEKRIKDFLEQICIVKLLGWESPIFKTLFDGLSIRELVLLLKESSERIYNSPCAKTSKDSKENTNSISKEPVSSYCFSDIYQKISNLNVEHLSMETRKQVLISEENKPDEFHSIHKEITRVINTLEYNLNKGNPIDPFFIDFYRQSLLIHNLYMRENPKATALFWLWLGENFLFMNGFLNNFPRLLLIELLRHAIIPGNINFIAESDNLIKHLKSLNNTLNTWGLLKYSFKELETFLMQYEFETGSLLEAPGTFKVDLLSQSKKLSKLLFINLERAKIKKSKSEGDEDRETLEKLDGLIVEKYNNKQIFLPKLLERTQRHLYDAIQKEKDAYYKVFEKLCQKEGKEQNESESEVQRKDRDKGKGSEKTIPYLAIDKALASFIDKILSGYTLISKQEHSERLRVLFILTLYTNLALRVAHFYCGNLKEAYGNTIKGAGTLANLLSNNFARKIEDIYKDISNKLDLRKRKANLIEQLDNAAEDIEKLIKIFTSILEQVETQTEQDKLQNKLKEDIEKLKKLKQKIQELRNKPKKDSEEQISNSEKEDIKKIKKEIKDLKDKYQSLRFFVLDEDYTKFLKDELLKNIDKFLSTESNSLVAAFLEKVKNDIEIIKEYLLHENKNPGD